MGLMHSQSRGESTHIVLRTQLQKLIRCAEVDKYLVTNLISFQELDQK